MFIVSFIAREYNVWYLEANTLLRMIYWMKNEDPVMNKCEVSCLMATNCLLIRYKSGTFGKLGIIYWSLSQFQKYADD